MGIKEEAETDKIYKENHQKQIFKVNVKHIS
jgi:hypothetical protein